MNAPTSPLNLNAPLAAVAQPLISADDINFILTSRGMPQFGQNKGTSEARRDLGTLRNTLAGAGAGALAGTAIPIPIIGTTVGAITGAIAGGVGGGLNRDRKMNRADRTMNELLQKAAEYGVANGDGTINNDQMNFLVNSSKKHLKVDGWGGFAATGVLMLPFGMLAGAVGALGGMMFGWSKKEGAIATAMKWSAGAFALVTGGGLAANKFINSSGFSESKLKDALKAAAERGLEVAEKRGLAVQQPAATTAPQQPVQQQQAATPAVENNTAIPAAAAAAATAATPSIIDPEVARQALLASNIQSMFGNHSAAAPAKPLQNGTVDLLIQAQQAFANHVNTAEPIETKPSGNPLTEGTLSAAEQEKLRAEVKAFQKGEVTLNGTSKSVLPERNPAPAQEIKSGATVAPNATPNNAAPSSLFAHVKY